MTSQACPTRATRMYRMAQGIIRKAASSLHPVKEKLVRLNKATFGKHLLLTNISVSVSLSALGDSLQQRYQMSRGGRCSYDCRRVAYMSGCGMGAGVLCHYWYLALDRWWVGRSIGVVAKKVLVDQLVFSPVLIATFLVSLEVFRGRGARELVDTFQAKFMRLYLAEWTVWPPAQAFSFYCLPTRYRVLWDNTVSLGYDCYTSYVIHDDEDDDDDDLPFAPAGLTGRLPQSAGDRRGGTCVKEAS
ncbi:mpv17-like protein 2 isoform X1 [Amphibalanus amphitrite]|uniref:mpv17-like protein 2 isoform X1 n=1 Tax=Amphibalanus amphitrite TaxID=1232801 RepID=UPI001C929779|nr:mpv17-like protein 2 isoform X1 [Amphibalanus amphitrite]